jgi:hypothetical protein
MCLFKSSGLESSDHVDGRNPRTPYR